MKYKIAIIVAVSVIVLLIVGSVYFWLKSNNSSALSDGITVQEVSPADQNSTLNQIESAIDEKLENEGMPYQASAMDKIEAAIKSKLGK